MCAAKRSPRRPREGRTGAGEVEFLYEVVNQDGEAAMTQRSVLLLKQRPQLTRELAGLMFYEDIRIGQSAALGETVFSREAILDYGRRFDPRIVAQAAEGQAPLAASGLHVAAAGMRRLVDTRSSLRAAMAERGETLPQLGVSPGFTDMRWPCPVHEGDIVSYSMETVSKRETSKPKWGLITNRFRGVNQRGQEVLVFSSAVLIARRSEDL